MLRKLRYIAARVIEARAHAARQKGDLEKADRMSRTAEEIYRRLDEATADRGARGHSSQPVEAE